MSMTYTQTNKHTYTQKSSENSNVNQKSNLADQISFVLLNL